MSGWTEERTAELKRLWMKGRSASQIGGVTRCAVIGKLHRLGLVRNPSVPVTLARTAKAH